MNDDRQTEAANPKPVHKATLQWEKDLVFTSTTPRGYDLEFDSENEWGCMPVESLMMSLGGCMAMDVVTILRKMRCEITSFRMDMEGVRRASPPKRFERFKMILHLDGEGLTPENVGRAVDLSRDTYCSVLHTLKDDLEIEVEVRLGS